MLGIYIGLMALADSLSPGRDYPKAIVLTPAALSLVIDVLIIIRLFR